MSDKLKLLAEDAADLDVMAAAAQDALVRVRDVTFDARTRRFTAIIDRFCWEKTAGAEATRFQRVRAALSFESVLGVKSKHVRRDMPDAIASILSFSFAPAEEPPGGVVRIVLAGGGEIALDVECLDALLVDISEAWATPRRPDHEKA